MYRKLVPWAVVLAILPAAGCGLFGKKNADAGPYADTGAYSGASQGAQTYATPVENYGNSASADAYANSGSAGARYHTVSKKDTLFSIARQHYNGDQSKWRQIYQANKAEIGDDPNRIRVGQKLSIP